MDLGANKNVPTLGVPPVDCVNCKALGPEVSVLVWGRVVIEL